MGAHSLGLRIHIFNINQVSGGEGSAFLGNKQEKAWELGK